MKSQQEFELKQWNGYNQLVEMIYSIMWGQYDNLMKPELKLQTVYAAVSDDSDIIELLKLLDMVCFGGEFEQIREATYWILVQYQNAMNYSQSLVKPTGKWLQELDNLYDAHVSYAGSLAWGQKIMIEVLAEIRGPGTLISHYFDWTNTVRVSGWDQQYKDKVMTRLMIMLADMKPTQTTMDDLLSLGQANPSNNSLHGHKATAIVHNKVASRQL